MKPIWSDHLLPMLKSPQAGFVLEFMLGGLIVVGEFIFVAIVLYLHQKGSDL